VVERKVIVAVPVVLLGQELAIHVGEDCAPGHWHLKQVVAGINKSVERI